jgi:DNA-binding phage protein
MPLTRDFKETVMEDMRKRPQFRVLMLREGIDALLGGELQLGKEILRDYINATMGFDILAREVDIPSKSLMRMLGPVGNPQASNLLAIIGALQRHAGIELHLAEIPPPKKARTKKRKAARAPRPANVRYPEMPGVAHGAFREAGRAFKRR